MSRAGGEGRHRWRGPALLAALGCGLSLAVAGFTGALTAPQRWEYSEVAEHVLEGQDAYYETLGARYYFYGPAAYHRLLAGVLWASGRADAAVVVVQALVFGLTALVICAIGSSIVDRRVGVLGALLAILHPGGLVYVGKLHSQTLDTFLMAASFLALLRLRGRSGVIRGLGAGAVLGLATLSRGTVLPFAGLWAIRRLWMGRRELRRAVGLVAAAALGGALVVAPEILRGYRRYGMLIPLRTDTGLNLWYGNHPGASGTSFTLDPTPVPVVHRMPAALVQQLAGKTEVEQHRLLTATVWDAVQRNPAKILRLFLQKLWYFWWASPHTGLRYPRAWTAAYQAYYVAIGALALAGLLSVSRCQRPAAREGCALFGLLALGVSAAQAAFYVEGRHRWQIEPLLLVFTAAGCLHLVERLRARRAPPGARLLRFAS